MNNIITYNFNENFIDKVSEFVDRNVFGKGVDSSKVCIVFEGKRPSLFLKNRLAKRLGRPFASFRFFSIDEFVAYLLRKKRNYSSMPDMELCYLIYNLAKKISPQLLESREAFCKFLPWAREIADFLDLLDREGVEDASLENIQENALKGYEIPENINKILASVIKLRQEYHRHLLKSSSLPAGFVYHLAASFIDDIELDEFDLILFCGFFYTQKTERKILAQIFKRGSSYMLFQGDSNEWPILKDLSTSLDADITPKDIVKNNYELKLYKGFDVHSQVSIIKSILDKIDDYESTVIVLSDPDHMIPLVSEIAGCVEAFNISLGYPLKRSNLYSLFELIIRSQKTRKGNLYYAKDYCTCLTHPLVKGLKIFSHEPVSRILVHKIEELFLGIEDGELNGMGFVGLSSVEGNERLFELINDALKAMDIELTREDLKKGLVFIHKILFHRWEEVGNFSEFAELIEDLLDMFVNDSSLGKYPLNVMVAERVYTLTGELYNASFSKEKFPSEDIFKIFQNVVENFFVKFKGSPLRGLQILGLWETRSLNFKNVIMLDANEGVLPKLKIYQPFMPNEVTLGLGIDRVMIDEQIYHYLFNRLITGAGNVHIVYNEANGKQRSRYVERLIWDRERAQGKLGVLEASSGKYAVDVLPKKSVIEKSDYFLEFLKTFTYSVSSINAYLQCPLMFYYKYGLRLQEREEFAQDPEGRHIGTFIHELLEDMFRQFLKRRPYVDNAFRGKFFKEFDAKFKSVFEKSIPSEAFLLEKVMRYRLEKFLEFEGTSQERSNVQSIVCLEQKFYEDIVLDKSKFKFTYIVDRVDRLDDNSLLIVDYKTGAENLMPGSLDNLKNMKMERRAIKDIIKSFQLPLYYHCESRKTDDTVKAVLYNLRNLKISAFPDTKKHPDIDETMRICLESLDFIISEIFDPKIPFVPDDSNERICANCPFFYLCR
ncbi:MAG: PD-(D/E)XK nuclease family protein [Candidatus Omnitrophota bacterium]